LDLVSLFSEKPMQYLLSFSEKPAFFAQERSYGGKDYPKQVYLPIPIVENGSWDFDSLVFLFLHESSQGALLDEYRVGGWTPQEYERKSNAKGLFIARELKRLYPKENFVDIDSFILWIQKQLQGYDTDKNVKSIKRIASRKQRKFFRSKRN
jgi:hypothetical protein